MVNRGRWRRHGNLESGRSRISYGGSCAVGRSRCRRGAIFAEVGWSKVGVGGVYGRGILRQRRRRQRRRRRIARRSRVRLRFDGCGVMEVVLRSDNVEGHDIRACECGIGHIWRVLISTARGVGVKTRRSGRSHDGCRGAEAEPWSGEAAGASGQVVSVRAGDVVQAGVNRSGGRRRRRRRARGSQRSANLGLGDWMPSDEAEAHRVMGVVGSL